MNQHNFKKLIQYPTKNSFNVIRNSSHIPKWLIEAGGGTKLATDTEDIAELKRVMPLFRKLKLYNDQLHRFMLRNIHMFIYSEVFYCGVQTI